MTTPFPPQAPKKLERSRSDKFLFGVCGGVARYLDLDPTLVRVLTVLITLFTGAPVIVYLVAVFVMPEERQVPPAYPPVGSTGSWPSTEPDTVWGPEGAPWEQPPTAAAPAASNPTSWADPAPSEPSDPQPPAPTDPEAPVVPPKP